MTVPEPATEVIQDSPRDWVAEHIRMYVESNGAEGHLFHGIPTLLLTTRGRRTAMLRRTALVYGQDGDRYFMVASDAGAPQNPRWYDNLVADPEVSLQVGPDTFTGRARTASADEKTALWPQLTAIFPQFSAYQDATERELPVVIVEREAP
jgi:deazaflavin-dependent oxidoreductase (nitroreductase family)